MVAARKIPAKGPLIFVANHPYGVLDGIVICLLASRTALTKILINALLCRAPELDNYVLPVDFELTPQALQTNLASANCARAFERGWVADSFPAGGIASLKIFSRDAFDEDWAPLVEQTIRRTEASVGIF